MGVANPSIGGSSGLENQYVVDGVNITNGGYGALGSYSIVFGSLGNGTPYDFMQEVQVKTGGYEAEFGQATGGVINVVTKSGSNPAEGQRLRLRPAARPRIRLRQTVQSIDGTVNTVASRLSDAGATVGGPILRNRLFFFGAIDPQWQTHDVPCAAGISARGARRRRSRPTHHELRGEGRPGRPSRRASLRRLVLRRSGDWRTWDRSDVVAAESRRRRATARWTTAATIRPFTTTACGLALSRRCLVRPRAQSHSRDAGDRRLAKSPTFA